MPAIEFWRTVCESPPPRDPYQRLIDTGIAYLKLAPFIHQGGERSGRRVEMINVGLHRRASSAAALTAE